MSIIIIFLAVACYLVWRNFGLPGGFTDLQNTILEARMVQDDLNSILEKSLNISQEIVTNIDNRLTQMDEEKQLPGDKLLDPGLSTEDSSFDIKPKKKIRIYEMARGLGITSRDLIYKMQATGYFYDNPLNSIDEVTAGIILDAINSGGKAEENSFTKVKHQPLAKQQIEVTSDNVVETEDSQDLETWITGLKEAHPYMAVKALADKGYSIRDIAQILDRGQGEVNLILNLVNKKRVSM